MALASGLVGGTAASTAWEAHPTYLECEDTTTASSCRTFDANGHQINHTQVAPAVVSSGEDTKMLAMKYATGAGSSARVRVTVFEWGAQRLGPFGVGL